MSKVDEFHLFPQYKYTKLQQNRINFSYARVEKYRSAIFAANKDLEPNKIAIVYIAGYDKNIRNWVLKRTTGNVVALCADIPKEQMEIHDAYWNMVNRCVLTGFCDQDGNFNEVWEDHVKKFKDFKDDPREMEDVAKSLKLIDDYDKLKKDIGKSFKRYIICDKLHPEKTIAPENLNWIVKRYFPRGMEEQGCTDIAVRISKIKDAVIAGIRREETPKLFGLPPDAVPSECFKTAIKRCLMDMNIALRDVGKVDLEDVFNELQKPPYGWSTECHAGYCFGYALSNYLNNEYYLFNGVNSFLFDERIAQICVSEVFNAGHTTFRHVKWDTILYHDEAWRLVNRFMLMFDAPEIHPFNSLVQQIVHDIQDKRRIRIPIAIVDDELPKVLREIDGYDSKLIDDTKQMIKHFTLEKCKEIKTNIDNINEFAKAMIQERYPDKSIDMEEIIRFCTSYSSGWLWDAEDFWRHVDMLLNNNWDMNGYDEIVERWRENRRNQDAML